MCMSQEGVCVWVGVEQVGKRVEVARDVGQEGV